MTTYKDHELIELESGLKVSDDNESSYESTNDVDTVDAVDDPHHDPDATVIFSPTIVQIEPGADSIHIAPVTDVAVDTPVIAANRLSLYGIEKAINDLSITIKGKPFGSSSSNAGYALPICTSIWGITFMLLAISYNIVASIQKVADKEISCKCSCPAPVPAPTSLPITDRSYFTAMNLSTSDIGNTYQTNYTYLFTNMSTNVDTSIINTTDMMD